MSMSLVESLLRMKASLSMTLTPVSMAKTKNWPNPRRMKADPHPQRSVPLERHGFTVKKNATESHMAE